MSELKARQLRLIEVKRTVKEIVADGFAERMWKREQKRQQRIAYARVYKARMQAEEALAAKRSSAAIGGKS